MVMRSCIAMTHEDLEIVRAVLAGDREAYADLVRAHQARVRGLCLSLLLNATEADDAAQDVFIKAYESLSKFRHDSSFSTWLCRIASNHCLDLLRKKSRHKTDSLDALLEQKGEQIRRLLVTAQEIPDSSEALHGEKTELIQKVLGALPMDHREILILREAQGLSYEEIGSILGCSLDAVKARLRRARQRMEEKFRHFWGVSNV